MTYFNSVGLLKRRKKANLTLRDPAKVFHFWLIYSSCLLAISQT